MKTPVNFQRYSLNSYKLLISIIGHAELFKFNNSVVCNADKIKLKLCEIFFFLKKNQLPDSQLFFTFLTATL